MENMPEKEVKIIPLRLNDDEWDKLKKSLDPNRKVSTQVKEIVFSKLARKSPDSLSDSLPDARLETLILKERLEKMTTLMGLLVGKLDNQDAFLEKVAADVARTKLVVENIQDYLAGGEGG